MLHETRKGEMATLGEMPFRRYYGSVDATPLFVLLAGAYFERTADRKFAESIWPNVEAALAWVDKFGDRDGDGFIEYQRQTADGLLHQGWKDSDDAISHADGTLAGGPIALCEVQSYVYAARGAGAVLAKALGMADRAAVLENQAEGLRNGSKWPSGARTSILMHWPSTAPSGHAESGLPTPASAFSAASSRPNEPRGWLAVWPPPNSFQAGESAHWRTPRPATTRWPITTARFGRTIML